MTTVSRPDDLGPALRGIRVAEGMTQSALAESADVGRQWLNAFEAGDKPSARLDMVLQIIAVLGVPVTLSRPAPPDPVDEAEPVDLGSLLDDDDV